MFFLLSFLSDFFGVLYIFLGQAWAEGKWELAPSRLRGCGRETDSGYITTRDRKLDTHRNEIVRLLIGEEAVELPAKPCGYFLFRERVSGFGKAEAGDALG